MTEHPWRARHFGSGYSAEFLPCGERTWRILKVDGRPIEFPTDKKALKAAEEAYIRRRDPTILSTVPVNPERVAAKLADEAENWLRTRHQDIKAAYTERKAGRKPFQVVTGRAR